jgi:hypothetical protein
MTTSKTPQGQSRPAMVSLPQKRAMFFANAGGGGDHHAIWSNWSRRSCLPATALREQPGKKPNA